MSDETTRNTTTTLQRRKALVREAIELLRKADEVLGSIIDARAYEHHDYQ
ncbi:hypothetical protein GWN65_07005 [Candidatus Bathyarchaeota archaeon]|nr:hypothetical protein [Candidatus Bathyarchaeota archaeon]NIU39710.1 hypothetical protein [Candidatus Bathyarchaeota archaeon]NIV45022.1 hypothetical protein [Candidatus Bathyarchaeota archaeon]